MGSKRNSSREVALEMKPFSTKRAPKRSGKRNCRIYERPLNTRWMTALTRKKATDNTRRGNQSTQGRVEINPPKDVWFLPLAGACYLTAPT